MDRCLCWGSGDVNFDRCLCWGARDIHFDWCFRRGAGDIHFDWRFCRGTSLGQRTRASFEAEGSLTEFVDARMRSIVTAPDTLSTFSFTSNSVRDVSSFYTFFWRITNDWVSVCKGVSSTDITRRQDIKNSIRLGIFGLGYIDTSIIGHSELIFTCWSPSRAYSRRVVCTFCRCSGIKEHGVTD